MFEIGQIVFSKAGRDKKRAFVVVSTEGDYLFLADGSLRPLNKPKKKKIMHIQKTNFVSEDLKVKLVSGSARDSDITESLTKWNERLCKF